MSAYSKYTSKSHSKYRSKKNDELWKVVRELYDILKIASELNEVKGVTLTLGDDEKGVIAKVLKEFKEKHEEVPLWDNDACFRVDYSYNQMNRTWVLRFEMTPITHCRPETLVAEYKKLRAELKRLLKEELWVREVKEGDGGDSQ